MEAKMTLKKEQYLILLGLEQLLMTYRTKLKQVEEEIASQLSQPDKGYGYYGHVSDGAWEDSPIDYMLDKLSIKKPKM